MNQMNQTFFALDPELILSSVEAYGLTPTGEFQQLNSYENRVFDVKLEPTKISQNHKSVIAKFYRPGRWSEKSIQDEHQFLFDLSHEGIETIPPLQTKSGDTLVHRNGIIAALFPKIYGRPLDEILTDDLPTIGKLIAQIHNVGAQSKAPHRQVLSANLPHLSTSIELLKNWVAPELTKRYFSATTQIHRKLSEKINQRNLIRLHGDFHRGNLLSSNGHFFAVDYDDFFTGPAVQDFWMLLSGDNDIEELDLLLSGYCELRDFDYDEISLIPFLRAHRIINYSAWIAQRWEDPFFKKIFVDFASYKYWAQETEALEKICWQN